MGLPLSRSWYRSRITQHDGTFEFAFAHRSPTDMCINMTWEHNIHHISPWCWRKQFYKDTADRSRRLLCWSILPCSRRMVSLYESMRCNFPKDSHLHMQSLTGESLLLQIPFLRKAIRKYQTEYRSGIEMWSQI